MGKNAKFLYLSNGKFSEIFKIEIFLSLNLFLYELWSFKHQHFFWKFTLKAECSKVGTISDFWLYLPFFVVLQENIRFVLKTSLTKLSNEYKNIIIPQWNDWENWVWIRAADFIDVACRWFYLSNVIRTPHVAPPDTIILGIWHWQLSNILCFTLI